MKSITLTHLKTALKVSTFITLAAFSLNALAGSVYVGNPNRPDTIWKPGKCKDGCWKQGKYLKVISPVCCKNIVWVDGRYDKYGNYVPAHWRLIHYKVINHKCGCTR